MKSSEGTADDTAARVNNNNIVTIKVIVIVILMIIIITSNSSSSCNKNKSDGNNYNFCSSIKSRENTRRYIVASLLSQTSSSIKTNVYY